MSQQQKNNTAMLFCRKLVCNYSSVKTS